VRRLAQVNGSPGSPPGQWDRADGDVYRAYKTEAALTSEVTIVPANEASWEDLQAVFGTRGEAARCFCQRFKTRARAWDSELASSAPERAALLREQTHCGHPESDTTSGLVAYLDGEPVGWCAVEPRTAYVRLQRKPIVWAGREEDKADESVWAVTCFVTRAGFRRRGISRALARATVDFARESGARALEGYPMITEPGKNVTWGEVHVGTRSIFEASGFEEVSHQTLRRVVMRIDF
jgi:GNAT superfamily N-acetyltransferase